MVENEDLVNLPNWLPLIFRPEGGQWLDLEHMEIEELRQTLSTKHGLLHRHIRYRDAQQRETTVSTRRIVHMADPHLAALELTVTPHNWGGNVEIWSALDASITNSGVKRYRSFRGKHLRCLETGQSDPETIWLKAQTIQSEMGIAEAARTRAFSEGRPIDVSRALERDGGIVAHRMRFPVRRGHPIAVQKVVSLFSSRDRAISEPGLAAREHLRDAGDFDGLLGSHKRAWKHLWRQCDLELGDDNGQGHIHDQKALRLHIFHLLQTTSMNTIELDVGVPARGLHGEAYRGHIFWDELFIFPYLNMRVPEVTRALLLYRYRRLAAARRHARTQGFEGALYPWQSGSDGREESQTVHLNPRSGRWLPDNSSLQRHVNAAIAYNVWSYYQVTADYEFLSAYGAEMFLEIARFFASLATWSPDRERYEIRGVMGPDEYHDAYPDTDQPGLNNNAYTNVMACWVLSTAARVIELLDQQRRRALADQLMLSPMELDRWDEISRRIQVCFHDGGIISQFEGYDRLRELDWNGYKKRYGNIQRLDRILESEGDTPNRYKLSKQADVLMLFYLFSAEELGQLFDRMGYELDPAMIRANIDYYLSRTSHGSTLSNIVHSWVLARAGRPGAWSLFQTALQSDISDIQGGTTHEGIHLGAMAGTVDIVQRAFTGLEVLADALRIDPRLPDDLRWLRFRARYRGHTLAFEMNHEWVRVEAIRGPARPVELRLGDRGYALCPGDTLELSLPASQTD